MGWWLLLPKAHDAPIMEAVEEFDAVDFLLPVAKGSRPHRREVEPGVDAVPASAGPASSRRGRSPKGSAAAHQGLAGAVRIVPARLCGLALVGLWPTDSIADPRDGLHAGQVRGPATPAALAHATAEPRDFHERL